MAANIERICNICNDNILVRSKKHLLSSNE